MDNKRVERPGELERHLCRIILNHGRSGVLAGVHGLVQREAHPDRVLNASLRYLLAVNAERAKAAFAEAAAVVFELECDRVVPGVSRRVTSDRGLTFHAP